MIYFENVKFKNFLSTGNVFTKIQLNRDPMTMITGTNGAGKTTMLDAIVFALFNRAYRPISKPQLINSINNKELVVEINFSAQGSSYKVIRGVKPTKFEIWKDEVLVDQNADAREYQDYLEREILRMSYKTFCQVVVLGSTTYIPFMRLPTKDRRLFIEDVLDLDVFTRMNAVIKERVSGVKKTFEEIDRQLESTNALLTAEKRHLRDMEQSKKEDADYLQQQADSYAASSNEELKKIEETERNIKLLDEQLSVLREDYNSRSDVHHQHKIAISKFKELVQQAKFFIENDVCPTCSQNIEDDIRNKIVSENKSTSEQLKSSIEKMSAEINELTDIGNKITELSNSKNDLLRQESSIQSKIASNNTSLKQIQQRIVQLQNAVSNEANESKIKELSSEIAELGDRKRQTVSKGKLLAAASHMLKDTGIKASIIKQYIPVFNATINKYLSIMDFFVNFEIDENFEETIRSRHRDSFSYASFSEGEKMRIDLSILFAWREIAKQRNSVATNLLIFDEVLDSSTDQAGLDGFFNIVKTVSKESHVFVISHTQEMWESKFNRVLRVYKSKNFSIMEDAGVP